MADVDGIGLRTDESADDVGEPPELVDHLCCTPRPFDRASVRERIGALESHHVRVRHDPDHVALRVRHWDVMDTVLKHREEHVLDRHVGSKREDREAHHLLDRGVRTSARSEDPSPQVAVGQDAEPIPCFDEEGRDPFARHQRGGLSHGCGRRTHHGRPSDQLLGRRQARIQTARISDIDRSDRSPSETRREERHPGFGSEHFRGHGGVRQVAEGVVMSASLYAGTQPRQQGRMPEEFALFEEIEHTALVE